MVPSLKTGEVVVTLRNANYGDISSLVVVMLEICFHSGLLLFVIYPFSPKILYPCSSLCFQRCLAGIPNALIHFIFGIQLTVALCYSR